MKLSLNWLKSYVKNSNINWDDVLEKLTMAGIELESLRPVGTGYDANNPLLSENVKSATNSDLEDQVVEFKITPNRGDCLSILGILREISALTDNQFELDSVNFDLDKLSDSNFTVKIYNPQACPNYLFLAIEGVNNQISLPNEILDKLKASGLRSVSPIVDIANYVMLLLGQPLHTFDLDKLDGGIIVRNGIDQEKLKLLDDSEVTITSDTLIIANANNQAVAIAGVMGSLDSGVITTSKNILIESAFFAPEIISGKAKQYGLNSDAAYRFERGVDPKLQYLALQLCAKLIIKYCGGKAATFNQVNSKQIPPISIKLPHQVFENRTGVGLTLKQIAEILQKLQFQINQQTEDWIEVTPPSYRFDINCQEDLIEEILRVYGYDQVHEQMPTVTMTMNQVDESLTQIDSIKTKLVDRGYSEIISYSFIENDLEQDLGRSDLDKKVKLQNPIAGLSVMRTSLIPNLVKALLHNVNHGAKSVRLFEFGRVFYGDNPEDQLPKIGGIAYGFSQKSGVNSSKQPVDFFDIKQDITSILVGFSTIIFDLSLGGTILHPGRCAKITAVNGEYDRLDLGVVGQLHPIIVQNLGLDSAPILFELNAKYLLDNKNLVRYMPFSKMPKVERDLAFLIDQQVCSSALVDAIKNGGIFYLYDVWVFDVYIDANLAERSMKSVAMKMIFQAEKTLNESEINASTKQVLELLTSKFSIMVR